MNNKTTAGEALDLNKSRAEFEAYAADNIGPWLERASDGSYLSGAAERGWQMWRLAEKSVLARRSLPVDAAGIKTWRERLLPGYEECDEREARDAEVAELRAALARAGSAAPTGQQAKTGCDGTGQASNDMPCLGCDNCPEFFSAKEAIAAGQQAEPVAKCRYGGGDGEHSQGPSRYVECEPCNGTGQSPAPVSAAPAAPTDLSKHLRALATDPMYADHVHAKKSTLLAAAEEIERYYGGMMNWKRTAEAKDCALAAPTAAEGPSDEPDMLWWADDNERYAHDPSEFANDYANDFMQAGEEAEVRVDCAYRGGKRTMRISVVEKGGSTKVAWAWKDATPLPTKIGAGEVDAVVEANRKLLLDRSRVGINKYGVTLAASGLSRVQLAQHALEEALDLANYLQTIIQTDAAIAAQPKDTTDTKEKA